MRRETAGVKTAGAAISRSAAARSSPSAQTGDQRAYGLDRASGHEPVVERRDLGEDLDAGAAKRRGQRRSIRQIVEEAVEQQVGRLLGRDVAGEGLDG